MITAKQASEKADSYYFRYVEDVIMEAAEGGRKHAKAYLSVPTYLLIEQVLLNAGYSLCYNDQGVLEISW